MRLRSDLRDESRFHRDIHTNPSQKVRPRGRGSSP